MIYEYYYLYSNFSHNQRAAASLFIDDIAGVCDSEEEEEGDEEDFGKSLSLTT
jgi:hypothetical protein